MAHVKDVVLGRRVGADKGMVVLTVLIPHSAVAKDRNVFVADQSYRVVSIEEVHVTKGSDGGDVLLNVARCQGTEVPSAGDLIAASIDLKNTNNTVQAGVLSSTEAYLTLAEGDRIGFDFVGTMSALVGMAVTIKLIPASGVGEDNNNRRYWISEV